VSQTPRSISVDPATTKGRRRPKRRAHLSGRRSESEPTKGEENPTATPTVSAIESASALLPYLGIGVEAIITTPYVFHQGSYRINLWGGMTMTLTSKAMPSKIVQGWPKLWANFRAR
jgi:hypothetical protein